MRTTRAIIGAAGISLALALSACASNPGVFTAHGQEQVCGDLLGGTSPSDYSDISDGTQVTVIDSKNTVIATGQLSEDVKDTSTLESAYTFTVKVPHKLPRYGIQTGHNRGTVWFTEKEMEKGPGISLGC